MLYRQLFDPAVTSHADADRLLRTEPQVQLTNPPVLNNHSNDLKSHCIFPLCCLRRLSFSNASVLCPSKRNHIFSLIGNSHFVLVFPVPLHKVSVSQVVRRTLGDIVTLFSFTLLPY
jgi:hypothetical protein